MRILCGVAARVASTRVGSPPGSGSPRVAPGSGRRSGRLRVASTRVGSGGRPGRVVNPGRGRVAGRVASTRGRGSPAPGSPRLNPGRVGAPPRVGVGSPVGSPQPGSGVARPGSPRLNPGRVGAPPGPPRLNPGRVGSGRRGSGSPAPGSGRLNPGRVGSGRLNPGRVAPPSSDARCSTRADGLLTCSSTMRRSGCRSAGRPRRRST